ncbi:MAG TPA: sigma 54-interacting transcriptional regulator [Steroidobacteraceae bacterium]|jgi:two-component system nitrogen regulation response regulator GlnG
MSAAPLRVWLVDDDTSIRWVLERALKNGGMLPRAFDAAEPALAALRTDAPDVLITDIRMAGQSGLELLRRIHAVQPDLPVIVMTAYSDLGNAVSAYESGAFEYLAKPFDIDQAVDLVKRAANAANAAAAASAASAANAAVRAGGPNGAAAGVGARGAVGSAPGIAALLGRAPAMQQVFRAIGRLSRSSVNVLITGESGTGKELAARALHEHSPRERKPFIALNTSAIPAELLESELFGHEKGSFTGADALRRGRFEQADGGSLFLDEIGDMSTSLQTRLLRVLAEGEFYRVGGQTPIRVDVRVIAATHQNLEERVRTGLFREDLFHRLNVIRIELPPLRARREDIADLLEHYLGVAALELGVDTKSLHAETRERLVRYAWPGNVRELVNLCRRLTVLAPGSEIRIEDLPAGLGSVGASGAPNEDWTAVLAQWADVQAHAPQRPLLEDAMPAFERTLIRVALKHTQGHRQEAARLLGWGRNTLTRKLKELGMDAPGED